MPLLVHLLQDQGLPVGLLLMMQHLVDVSTAKRASAAAAASPSKPGKSPKGKKQAAAAAAEQRLEPATAAEEDEETWLAELMASLCEKVGAAAALRESLGCETL